MTTATQTPNLFDLDGFGGLHVSYSTTSIAGVPLFNYKYHGKDLSFRGDQIRVENTEIGQLVTVTIETIPDLHVITFSLLIPPINLTDHEARIQTEAIRTTARTSIGGPALVKGQLNTYESVRLHGFARAVVF